MLPNDVHNFVGLIQLVHLRHAALPELMELCLGVTEVLVEIFHIIELVGKSFDSLDETKHIILLPDCITFGAPLNLRSNLIHTLHVEKRESSICVTVHICVLVHPQRDLLAVGGLDSFWVSYLHLGWNGGCAPLLIIQHVLYARAIGIRLPNVFGNFLHYGHKVVGLGAIRKVEDVPIELVPPSLELGISALFVMYQANIIP